MNDDLLNKLSDDDWHKPVRVVITDTLTGETRDSSQDMSIFGAWWWSNGNGSDVPPCVSVDDVDDAFWDHTVLFGQLANRAASRGVTGANQEDQWFGEFGEVRSATTTTAALRHHVRRIIGRHSQKEMGRVDARSIVAVMTDEDAVFNLAVVVQFPGNPMSAIQEILMPKFTVPAGTKMAGPEPATVCLDDARPEPIRQASRIGGPVARLATVFSRFGRETGDEFSALLAGNLHDSLNGVLGRRHPTKMPSRRQRHCDCNRMMLFGHVGERDAEGVCAGCRRYLITAVAPLPPGMTLWDFNDSYPPDLLARYGIAAPEKS